MRLCFRSIADAGQRWDGRTSSSETKMQSNASREHAMRPMHEDSANRISANGTNRNKCSAVSKLLGDAALWHRCIYRILIAPLCSAIRCAIFIIAHFIRSRLACALLGRGGGGNGGHAKDSSHFVFVHRYITTFLFSHFAKQQPICVR